jgi:eukaryotic-like serine/threonine-protein kinase
MTVRAGARIAGRFVIDAEVGRGGMGTIYRARDEQTGALVAIKIVREDAERFEREADLLARMTHAGIVRHVAHGRAESGELFLAMEWLEGEDLQKRLARGPLAAAETLELARSLAAPLGEVHAAGVVHRDVKPSNIWLVDGRIDRPLLLDFGIARPIDAWRLTVTGHVVGTPQYMPPEQIQNPRDIDARADVYSLGAVVFECIAGRPPFVGDNAIAVLAKVLIEDAPSLRDLQPDAPERSAARIARSMRARCRQSSSGSPRAAPASPRICCLQPPHASAPTSAGWSAS